MAQSIFIPLRNIGQGSVRPWEPFSKVFGRIKEEKCQGHEEQSYNSCNGILHMCTGQSKLLVEEAARLCVEGNACRYSYFKWCLKQLTERIQPQEQKLPSHENLRGKEIYR